MSQNIKPEKHFIRSRSVFQEKQVSCNCLKIKYFQYTFINTTSFDSSTNSEAVLVDYVVPGSV